MVQNQTMETPKKNDGISPIKANRLYWMGRYAQRAYMALHLLRKHYDRMIDEDSSAYKDFCTKMGIENKYASPEDFTESYLYDHANPDAVINMLECLRDNAILVREEIKSETLSYIQLAINYMKSGKKQGKGLGGLQYITDCILAFWGSVDERIFTRPVRHIILFGKFVESIDLHIRFEYPHGRIENLYDRLNEYFTVDRALFDEIQFDALGKQLLGNDYRNSSTLVYLNAIFRA